MKTEMEKLNNNMQQLNDELKTVKAELLNEKDSNQKLVNSLKIALDRCQHLETEIKTRDGYKEKLEETAEKLEKVLAEKKSLRKRYIYLIVFYSCFYMP